jgi:hypothetical protein
MRMNFYGFDPSYHIARHRFVYRTPHAWTPLHLARHRRVGFAAQLEPECMSTGALRSPPPPVSESAIRSAVLAHRRARARRRLQAVCLPSCAPL